MFRVDSHIAPFWGNYYIDFSVLVNCKIVACITAFFNSRDFVRFDALQKVWVKTSRVPFEPGSVG
jgi:hypothetical protein